MKLEDLPVYAFIGTLPVRVTREGDKVLTEAWSHASGRMVPAPKYLRVIVFGRDDDGEYPEIVKVSEEEFNRRLSETGR